MFPTSPKRLSRLLFLVSAAFIVYGTTIPFTFNLSPDHIAGRLNRINWYPLLPGYDNSLFDDVQNILLFLPFGFLGWTAVRDKSKLWKALLLVLCACLLSASVEAVQILSNTRTPALTDIFFNTLGGALGVLAAALLRKWVHAFASHAEVRALAESEAVYPALLFAVLVLVGQLAPFDFTLDFSQFKSKIRVLLEHPLAFNWPSDDFVFAGRQMVLAVFLGRLLKQRGSEKGWLEKGWHVPVGFAFIAGTITAAYGLILELSQLIVSSRGPTSQDGLILILGAAAGALLVPVQGWRRRPWFSAWVAFAIVLFSVACKEMYPFRFGAWQGRFNWLPFLAEYSSTAFLALARFFEDSLAWVPLGFAWAYLSPVRHSLAWATGLALVSATVLETLQGFIPGRFPDITDLISAGVGAVAGHLLMSRGREAFIGYLTHPLPPEENHGG